VPRLALVLALPLLLAGCGKTINTGDLESKIADHYARGLGVKPKVDCPGGQESKKGNSFECDATIGSEKVTLVVTLKSDDGRFTYAAKQDSP